MDMPSADTSPEAYLPRSAYTIARVAADPDTAGLEKNLAAKHADLKAALREREDVLEQLQKDAALLDVGDGHCDAAVEGFELHLLGIVKKDREHLTYRRYFNNSLRDVTKAEPRKEEPEIIADLLDAMNDDKDDEEVAPAVAQWQPKLAAARAKVMAADEALTITEKTLAQLNDHTLPALMAAWCDEYKKLEDALTAVFVSNPKAVGRFFKAFRKSRKASKP
jgi:hypothetical protein